MLKLAATIGVLHGLWAIHWWLEPDGGVSSSSEFATFSFLTTGLVILAYWLANWSSSESFVLNRWTIIFIFGIFAIYFCFITVPKAPIAVIILPILLGLVYLGLRQNRSDEDEGSLLEALHGRASIWKYISLLAIPVTGVLVYTIALSFNLHWPTHWVLYIITTPLGFILFGISLYKLLRRKSVSASQSFE